MARSGARLRSRLAGRGGEKSTATIQRVSWSGRDTGLTILSNGQPIFPGALAGQAEGGQVE